EPTPAPNAEDRRRAPRRAAPRRSGMRSGTPARAPRPTARSRRAAASVDHLAGPAAPPEAVRGSRDLYQQHPVLFGNPAGIADHDDRVARAQRLGGHTAGAELSRALPLHGPADRAARSLRDQHV